MTLTPGPLYAFAFLKRPLPPEVPNGWQGKPVEFVEVGALAAAIDPRIPWREVQLHDEELLRAALLHDRVICDLFRQQPVLPLQFGTVFVSLDGLQQHLTRNADRYDRRITDLQGMGEYTLKLVPRDALRTLDEEQPEREREQLIGGLRACYDRVVVGAAQRGIERLHLLIPVQAEAQLRKRLVDHQPFYPCWELDLQGPLPPYHFA